MKFDQPAEVDSEASYRVLGAPVDRVEGRRKTTGTVLYANDWFGAPSKPAYGYLLGAAIAKGRIRRLDTLRAKAAPGVLAVVTHENAGPLGVGDFYVQRILAGPTVDHYHQVVAMVVAETFEQARFAAGLIDVDYQREPGAFDLAAQKPLAPSARQGPYGGPVKTEVGDFDRAFSSAAVRVDALYTTPDQAHAMMEPHATVAFWTGDQLFCRTAIQQLNWGVRDLAKIMGIPAENIRLQSPYVGGGFGGKGTTQSDLVMAALGARAARRPVKLALPRPLMFNNTIHRPATIQRIRIGADANGKITAIGHESWSGNLPGGRTEPATAPTRALYAGPHRMTQVRLAVLDLAEGNAMRAPGEATGLMALEIAIDELAETLKIDPVAFRILNDTQVDPENPHRPFSTRPFIACLTRGAAAFGWSRRSPTPGALKDGRWRVGLGVAAGIRGAPISRSAARVRLDRQGVVTVETDMTDIGTGSYTIVAQTAAEVLGVPLSRVVAKLGDSAFPESPGSAGQQGAASVTAGVYAACMALRRVVADRLGFDAERCVFADGKVRAGRRSAPLSQASYQGDLVAEDAMDYGDLKQRFAQQTFAAHFAEVAVDGDTGEVRVRRMHAVCAAGRILNPKLARSQVIGAMTMGIGAALMENMVVDTRLGFFVNHDLASYEVPVHADVPHMDVEFIEEVDPTMSPLMAKGVGELGLTGAAPAIANAIYNATGVRVRDYPITLEKYLEHLPLR